MEKLSAKTAQSQIYIETPYRNDAMLQDILQCCNGQTKLCIATNISAEDEKILTKTVAQWKQNTPQIGKRPTVFILSA